MISCPLHAALLYNGFWCTRDRSLLSQPGADAAKVRMYELFGNDLQSVGPSFGYNLPLYVWCAEVLKDFLAQRAPLPNLQLDRSRYQGEMLLIQPHPTSGRGGRPGGPMACAQSQTDQRRLYRSDSLHPSYDAGHTQRQRFRGHESCTRQSVEAFDIIFLRIPRRSLV